MTSEGPGPFPEEPSRPEPAEPWPSGESDADRAWWLDLLTPHGLALSDAARTDMLHATWEQLRATGDGWDPFAESHEPSGLETTAEHPLDDPVPEDLSDDTPWHAETHGLDDRGTDPLDRPDDGTASWALHPAWPSTDLTDPRGPEDHPIHPLTDGGEHL